MADAMTREACVAHLLRGCTWGAHCDATRFAPANIALCKYWGKRDQQLHLPRTDSLSVSLGPLGSTCRIAWQDGPDTYFLQGELLDPATPFSRRLHAYLDLFRGPDRYGYGYRVEAENSIPTAAGFASSASGFAALVQALDGLHGWGLDKTSLSILARLGSGSACRSLWQGFVHWHAGCHADGLDSYAEPLAGSWPDLRLGLLTVSADAKSVGSREAMQHTVATSPLYRNWPEVVASDMDELADAISQQDFMRVGACAEGNALAMHATMLAARPAVCYWQPASLQAIHAVQALRQDGVPVFFTMDAGPNLKLLFEEQARRQVEAAFPDVQVVSPWQAPAR